MGSTNYILPVRKTWSSSGILTLPQPGWASQKRERISGAADREMCHFTPKKVNIKAFVYPKQYVNLDDKLEIKDIKNTKYDADT